MAKVRTNIFFETINEIKSLFQTLRLDQKENLYAVDRRLT